MLDELEECLLGAVLFEATGDEMSKIFASTTSSSSPSTVVVRCVDSPGTVGVKASADDSPLTVGVNSEPAALNPAWVLKSVMSTMIKLQLASNSSDVKEQVGVLDDYASQGFDLMAASKGAPPECPHSQYPSQAPNSATKLSSACGTCSKLLLRQRSVSAAARRSHQLTAALQAYG